MRPLVFTMLVAVVVAFAAAAETPLPSVKVEICHIPPDEPELLETIMVSLNALETHLNHGDYLGSCEPAAPIVITEDCTVTDPGSPPTGECEYWQVNLGAGALGWLEIYLTCPVGTSAMTAGVAEALSGYLKIVSIESYVSPPTCTIDMAGFPPEPADIVIEATCVAVCG